MQSTPSTQHRGFTLLELLITVALIGILGAIAYPSYTSQVTRSRRAEAKVVLSKAALWMERNRSNTFSYLVSNSAASASLATTQTSLESAGLGRSPEGSGTQHYAIAVRVADADSYELTATPMGVQLKNDPNCILLVDHLGRKGRWDGTKAAFGGGAQDCWQR